MFPQYLFYYIPAENKIPTSNKEKRKRELELRIYQNLLKDKKLTM